MKGIVVDRFTYTNTSNPRLSKKKVMGICFNLAKERGDEQFYKPFTVKAADVKYDSDGDVYDIEVYGEFREIPPSPYSENDMTPQELAKHFGEPEPEPKKGPDFKTMTREEIEKWEQDQLNSNDIYRIAARVKNLARAGGASLTPVGEVMCNTYIHVLKDLYDFAEKQSEPVKTELTNLVRKHEDMPANLIAAVKAGVK